MPGDTEHRKLIFAAVGLCSSITPSPQGRRHFRERQAHQRTNELRRDVLRKVAVARRGAIIQKFSWDTADVANESPTAIDPADAEQAPRRFLSTLFPPEALLWTGIVYESGKAHAGRWRTCREWQVSSQERIGPMTSPAIWRQQTVSRTHENVESGPYTVLDFDGFDGVKPRNDAEVEAHLSASLAIVRWMRESLHWNLAAIVWTGGKSIHAWFKTPPSEVLASLKNVASELGVDSGLIGRPEHPCRLPGWSHEKTGEISRLLWLDGPYANSRSQSGL